MRADRLLSILLLLQRQGRLSSRALAERLEVSERTIHRDMEALSAAGIPVYAERGPQGGWMLAEGYRTALNGLKAEELCSLQLAQPAGVLQDLGLGELVEQALLKLAAALPAPARGGGAPHAALLQERLHIDGAGWHPPQESFPFLPVVQEAVWTGRRLCFAYPREGLPVERTVDPLGLVAKRQAWYLVGTDAGELRTYRISRITEARLLTELGSRPEGFNLAAWWEASTVQLRERLPRYPARIRLRPHVLPQLSKERYVQLGDAVPCGDGWLEAEAVFHTLDSACSMLLSYGAQVQAVGPAELYARLAEEVQALSALYTPVGQNEREYTANSPAVNAKQQLPAAGTTHHSIEEGVTRSATS